MRIDAYFLDVITSFVIEFVQCCRTVLVAVASRVSAATAHARTSKLPIQAQSNSLTSVLRMLLFDVGKVNSGY